jgi:hypothetical protein
VNDVARSPSVQTTREWWRGAAIYQIYPRSFADTNGDGIGDLPGITAHLDHVASLGVDAIWLSPFFTSPMLDFGYDVADYCDVDPIFGTLADFDALVARAHALGLKVLIDQVYSHSSDRHPWFLESRADPTPKRTGMSGPMPGPTVRRRTIGSRCSAAPPGPGARRGSNITCTISCPNNRSSICICRPCRTRCSTWRNSGSIAASMASASMRSTFRCTTRS